MLDVLLLLGGVALLLYALGSAVVGARRCARCGSVFDTVARQVIAYAWDERVGGYVTLCDPCYVVVLGEDTTAEDSTSSVETDERRDARHAPENDRVWGRSEWVRCPTCPRDAHGREVYHHRNAHDVEVVT